MNDWLKERAGTLVSAVLLAGVMALGRMWLTVHDLDRNYSGLKEDFTAFKKPGDRFTSKDGERLERRINNCDTRCNTCTIINAEQQQKLLHQDQRIKFLESQYFNHRSK